MSQRAVKPQKTKKPNPVVSGMRMPVYGCYHIYSKVSDKNAFRSVDSNLTTHSMILGSISRRFVVALNLQNSFPAGSLPRENWLHFFSFFSTALSFSFKCHLALNLLAFYEQTMITEAANVDAILFFSNGTFDVIK